MYNWSTDEGKFESQEKRDIWELEQLINFGLNGRRINEAKLRTYWSRLALDPHRRKFLGMVLNG